MNDCKITTQGSLKMVLSKEDYQVSIVALQDCHLWVVLVKCLASTAIMCDQALPEVHHSLDFFYVLCWWSSVLKVLHWQRLPVGYGNNDNRLRIGKKVEWMVCHSDCKYFQQRQLLTVITFPNLNDEDSFHHLHQKNVDIPFKSHSHVT